MFRVRDETCSESEMRQDPGQRLRMFRVRCEANSMSEMKLPI